MQEVGGSIPPSSTTTSQETIPLRKLDRNLLIIYLVAMLALLLFPVPEPKFQLLGIKSDKWMHVALFAGCAMMLRWNVTSIRLATVIPIGITVLFAAGIEIAQGLTSYRNAGWGDLLAGTLGAILGVVVMNRIMASPQPDRRAGTLIVLLGIMVAASSILADVIGAGNRAQFGPTQVAGTLLGMLLVLGGVAVYRMTLIGYR